MNLVLVQLARFFFFFEQVLKKLNFIVWPMVFFRPELLEQLWKARAEKKKLRKTLREFEEEFYQQNGRFV